MSGIFGVALQKGKGGMHHCDDILKRMREALPLNIAVDEDGWTSKDGRIGLAAIHARKIKHPKQFVYDKENHLACFMDGYLFSDAQYPAEITHNKSGAGYLLERYLDAGPKCVRDISGSFNVVWFDEKKDCLTLATDKIGQRLLFYGSRNGNFIFGSYIARLMAADLLSRDIDVESLADLMRISYISGEGTLFKDIRCLPTGSILTLEKGDMQVRKYWRIDQIEPHGSYNRQRLDEIEVRFKTAVSRSLTSGVKTAIGLTGGLDSRCILAAGLNMRLPFITYTGGQLDSTDVVVARQAAQAAGAEHFFEFIGPDMMAEWMLPMVLYQGGVVATLHCHPCQHFGMSFPFDAYIQGIGISYIRGQYAFPEYLNIHTEREVIGALKKKILKKDLEETGFEHIWQDKYRRICGAAFDKHLSCLWDDYEKKDRVVAFLDFYALNQQCRKFLNKANVIVRNVRENYFPYLDHELLIVLAELPIKERITNSIQVDLIRRMFPKLLKVPLAKTMRPIASSPLRDLFEGKYSAVKLRINRKSKVAHKRKAVPNHYLFQWSQHEMRENLENILYNPQAAFREYLDWGTIDRILKQHFSGRHNWESVLGTLVAFEISHHLWVDKQKIPQFFPGLDRSMHAMIEN